MEAKRTSPRSRLLRFLLIWLLVWLAATAVLWLAFGQPKEVTQDQIRRSVRSGIAFLSAPFDVKLTLLANRLPHCPNPDVQPVDVMLVLDHSDSMDGRPLDEVKRAVGVLLDNVDLSLHRVGIVEFNGASSLLSPVTSDADAILAAANGLQADDGTDIAGALATARANLPAEAGRARLVVLLSDGGSDRASAVAEADLLQQDGVQVMCIGFPGYDYDPDLLAAIASSPDDVILVNDPIEFSRAFEDVAHLVSQPLGRDLQVRESLNLDAFTAPSGVGNRLASSGGTILPWRLNVIPSSGAGFTYRLTPIRLGYHPLAPDGLSLSLIGCDGAPILGVLEAGPRILVLPPWPLLLALFLLPLLIGLLALLLWRPDPRLKYTPGQPYTGRPGPSLPHAELAAIETRDYTHFRGDPNACRPMFVIALGEAGLQALTLFKANLVSRYGAMPDKVRLLHADFFAPGRAPSATVADAPEQCTLTEDERLTWRVDYDETGVIHVKHIGFPAENWSQAGRHRGRAMLSADCATFGQSTKRARLQDKLQSRLAGLGAADAYLLVPAGGEESGMAFDLMRFLQDYGGASIAHLSLVLLSAGACGDHSPATIERQTATMRELGRIGVPNSRWQSLFRAEQESVGAGRIYVTETLTPAMYTAVNNPAAAQDLSAEPLSRGPLAKLADWLASLAGCLDPAVDDGRSKLESARIADYSAIHHPMVGAVGCLNPRFPIHEAHAAYEAQFLRTFFSDRGLFGAARPPSELDAAQIMLDPNGLDYPLVRLALDPDEARHFVADYVFEPDVIGQLVRGAGSAWRDALRLALDRVAQDGSLGGDPLGRCLALLDGTEARLDETRAILAAARQPEPVRSRRALGYELLADEEVAPLEDWCDTARDEIDTARAAIQAWRSYPGWRGLADSACVQARSAWDWQTSTDGVATAFELAGSRVPAFDDCAPEPQALALAKERWRWHWHGLGDAASPRLGLIHYGAHYDRLQPADQRQDRSLLSVAEAQDLARIWQAAQFQAHAAANTVYTAERWAGWRVAALEKATGSVRLAKRLVEGASLLGDHVQGEVSRVFRSAAAAQDPGATGGLIRFLLMPHEEDKRADASALTTAQISGESIAWLKWDDPCGMALVTLADRIPIEAMQFWNRYAYTVSPTTLLWPADRIVRQVDDQATALAAFARRQVPPITPHGQPALQTCWGHPLNHDPEHLEPILHAEFANYLNDADQTELFARALLYGLIQRERDRWVLTLADKREPLGALPGGDAVAAQIQGVDHPILAMRRFIDAPAGFIGAELLGPSLEDTRTRLAQALDAQRAELGVELGAKLLEKLELPELWACHEAGAAGRFDIGRSLYSWLVIVALRELGFRGELW